MHKIIYTCILTILILALHPIPLYTQTNQTSPCKPEWINLENQSNIIKTQLLTEHIYNYQIKYQSNCTLEVQQIFDPEIAQCDTPQRSMIEKTDDFIHENIAISCSPLRHGLQRLTPFEITLATSANQQEISTPPMQLIWTHIDSSLATAPILEPKFNPWPLFINKRLLLLLTVTLILLTIAVAIIIRRTVRFTKPFSNIPILPPAKEAIDKINQALALTRENIEDYKIYYDLISNALKTYISRKFEINALEQTTTELEKTLSITQLTPDEQKNILNILNEADISKFTNVLPNELLALTHAKNAMELIDNIEKHTITVNKMLTIVSTPSVEIPPKTDSP